MAKFPFAFLMKDRFKLPPRSDGKISLSWWSEEDAVFSGATCQRQRAVKQATVEKYNLWSSFPWLQALGLLVIGWWSGLHLGLSGSASAGTWICPPGGVFAAMVSGLKGRDCRLGGGTQPPCGIGVKRHRTGTVRSLEPAEDYAVPEWHWVRGRGQV